MEKTRTYVSLLNKDLSTSKLSCKLCRLKDCFKYNFLLSYIRSCRVTMLDLECYISTNKIWFWNLFLLNYNAVLFIPILKYNVCILLPPIGNIFHREKGRYSGSMACMWKKLHRFYWSCSSMKDGLPLTPYSACAMSTLTREKLLTTRLL